jgi:hypothetical protein
MAFAVRQIASGEKPVLVYRYQIFEGPRLIARYWHDHRGDEHGIEFIDGEHEAWPVGRMTDFLTGGGRLPFGLSDAAAQYLRRKRP